MGITSSNSQTKEEQFVSKLEFLFDEQTRQFGKVGVYRINEKPYNYYLKYCESGIDDEISEKNIMDKSQLYQNIEGHRNVVKIQVLNIRKVPQMCVKKIYMEAYARYYNFTLEDGIDIKIKKVKNFKEADMAYVLSCLASIGQKYAQKYPKQYSGIFKTQNIFLTPEGYIKIYPFYFSSFINKIQSEENSPTRTPSIFYATQELQLDLKKRSSGIENQVKVVNFRNDMKEIAEVMQKLLLLNRTKDNLEYSPTRKMKMENFNYQKTVLQKYSSQGFKSLLKNLFNNYSQLTYEGILSELQKLKIQEDLKPSYCIKLDDDIIFEDKMSDSKIVSEIDYIKKENLKKLSMHTNLKASRISVLKKNSIE